MTETVLQNGKRTIPEMSANTRLLIALGSKADIGTVLSHAEISDAIGAKQEDRTTWFGAWQSAQRALLRDEGMRFSAVRGVGYKRLNDEETVHEASAIYGAIRRKANRQKKRLLAVDYTKLSENGKNLFNRDMTCLTTFDVVTRQKNLEKILTQVKDLNTELAFPTAMKALEG